MFNEINWAAFDKLVESYAILSAYTDLEKSIETELASTCENLLARGATLEDFTDILGRKPQPKDEVVRKIAWASQHIFGCRAWCVGQKVLFQRRYEKRWESPLVQQIEKLGFQSSAMDLRAFHSSWPRSTQPQDRLDAMLLDAKADTLHLVKGVSFGQLRKLGRIERAGPQMPLFGRDARTFIDVTADAAAVATLLFARDLLTQSFPQLKVKAYFIAIDDPDSTWRFQLADLSSYQIADLRSGAIPLQQFPIAKTHADFSAILEANDDAFAQLPKWAHPDFLSACPVDRPTRCLMLLREMFARQDRRTTTLSRVSPSDVAAAVSESNKIAYPADLWRHDFEDCLERGRFVERWSDGDRFVLLPKGIARLLLVSRKFNRLSTMSSGELLQRLSDHAKLLASTPVL